MLRLVTLVVLLHAGAGGAWTAQQRDAPVTPSRTGTASIAGVVLSDDGQNRPLRRATVTITDAAQMTMRTIATDDSGRFVFRDVAAGRYLLTAAKGGYLTTAFGSKGP